MGPILLISRDDRRTISVLTNGDLVPDPLGPFLGGELQIPILLLRGRICRIGNLAPSSEREFHSFQQSVRVQWAITSSL